jgi:antagonist of KipI
MAMGEVRVLEPGLLTTIQDASGRPGLGRYGIPPGGAMDARAARLANRLVGGGGAEAVLEMTLQGPELDWLSGGHIGLAGADLGAMSDGRHLVPGHSYRVGPGAVIAFGVAQGGARAYLAVQGGFQAATVLGSVSTDRRSGFGGLDGRALRAGDVLRFAGSQDGPLRSAVRPTVDHDDERLAVIPTEGSLRSLSPAAVRAFCATEWRVAPDSDRNGIRLTGGALLASSTASIPSLPVPVGAVQVPPGGEPIIKMVDGPVTGGYPVLGVIPGVDHSRLAQVAPGATLRFRRISVAAARRLTRTVGMSELIELDVGDIAASWAR